MLMLFSAIVGLGTGILGIVAGIGLIKVARWGWGVTLAYAIVLLGYEGLMLHLIFDAVGWLYPILLIIFLNTPQWKNAFAARQLKGLNGSPFNIVIAGRAARTSTHDRHSRIQCLEAVLL